MGGYPSTAKALSKTYDVCCPCILPTGFLQYALAYPSPFDTCGLCFRPHCNLSRAPQLPVHAGVQIELDYVFIDSWDNEFARVNRIAFNVLLPSHPAPVVTQEMASRPHPPPPPPPPAKVMVDGIEEWRQQHAFNKVSAVGRVCGSGTARFQEDLAHIVIRLPAHTSRRLTLTARADLNTPGTDESFGISNVRIGPIQPGWPEIATFADADVHGWMGDAAKILLCGSQGRILGGPGNGGALTALSRRELLSSQWHRPVSSMRPLHLLIPRPLHPSHPIPSPNLNSVFQYLPSHNGLRLQLRLFFFDTWPIDAKVNIHVDGRLLWQGGRPDAGKPVGIRENDCQSVAQILWSVFTPIAPRRPLNRRTMFSLAEGSKFCGADANDAYVDLDLTHEFHTSSLAMVHISTTLASDDLEASFGIAVRTLRPPDFGCGWPHYARIWPFILTHLNSPSTAGRARSCCAKVACPHRF